MAQALFRVADIFSIRGRGVVVAADIPVSQGRFKLHIGDPVEFVRMDGSRHRTVVRGIEMLDPYDSERPFAFLVGQDIEKADIELGSKVYSVPQADA